MRAVLAELGAGRGLGTETVLATTFVAAVGTGPAAGIFAATEASKGGGTTGWGAMEAEATDTVDADTAVAVIGVGERVVTVKGATACSLQL